MHNRDHWRDRNDEPRAQRYAGGNISRSRGGEFNDEDQGNGRNTRYGENENWRYQDRDGEGRFMGGSRNLGNYGDKSGVRHSPGHDERDRGIGDYFSGAGMGDQSYRGRAHSGQYGEQRREEQRHDDDYNHWRNQQIGKFDDDYTAFRDERRKKFADEFDKWRTDRGTKAGTQAGIEAKR